MPPWLRAPRSGCVCSPVHLHTCAQAYLCVCVCGTETLVHPPSHKLISVTPRASERLHACARMRSAPGPALASLIWGSVVGPQIVYQPLCRSPLRVTRWNALKSSAEDFHRCVPNKSNAGEVVCEVTFSCTACPQSLVLPAQCLFKRWHLAKQGLIYSGDFIFPSHSSLLSEH